MLWLLHWVMYDLVAEKNLDDIREYSNRISEELELDLLVIMDNFGNVIGGANDQKSVAS